MKMAKGDILDMRAVARSLAAGAAAVALGLSSVSCGDAIRQGRSPVLLVIDALQGASGAEPDQFGGFLLSDVETLVERTVAGQTEQVPTIFNDLGQGTLRIVLKDQGTGVEVIDPSEINVVTLHRYRVVYRRADGRNTPGVDVPHAIDGAVTATINNIPTVVPFEMVRHQAKLEPPLLALARGGGRVFISTIAEVTFFGKDLAGNEVQTTGTISVSFADYADPL